MVDDSGRLSYSIIQMGNELCGGQPEEQLQRIDYNPDDQHQDEEINRIIRNGEPSDFVGYNINALPADLKEAGKLSELQERITKLMANDRRHHRPLVIRNKKANELNALPNPYYLRYLKAVYIGEWVLDKDCNQVVPGGLGRLYTEDRIIEGEILTKANSGMQFFDESSVAAAMPAFMHNKEKAKFFAATATEPTTSKKDLLAMVGTVSNDECLRMEVILNGEGRSFTRTSQESGMFKDGLLEGKGQIRSKDGEDIYEYTGEFRRGKKHGKGIEKFKLTSYDGDFEEDRKKGKGTLTMLISRAYDEERLQEETKLSMLDKQRDPSEKVKRVKDFIKLRKEFEAKLAEELKEFKWVPPKYPTKSLLDNENFVIDHYRRTKFLENYKGEFLNDKFHGQGIYSWFNGKCYSGEWKNGQMDGVGEFYWPKGTVYRGHYEKDMRHDKGEMIWSFDKRFRGSWAYGIRHGYGQFIEIETQPAKDPQPGQEKHIYFLRVKGVLFDKDEIKKTYFNTRRQVDGLNLQYLKLQEKLMIAFSKDIRIDDPGK